jgi:hypothetical protein
MLFDFAVVNPVDPFEILCTLDQLMQVKIWRYRVKSRSWPLCRHVGGCFPIEYGPLISAVYGAHEGEMREAGRYGGSGPKSGMRDEQLQGRVAVMKTATATLGFPVAHQ